MVAFGASEALGSTVASRIIDKLGIKKTMLINLIAWGVYYLVLFYTHYLQAFTVFWFISTSLNGFCDAIMVNTMFSLLGV
jgi:predicted MFS family arabinose efflux permease